MRSHVLFLVTFEFEGSLTGTLLAFKGADTELWYNEYQRKGYCTYVFAEVGGQVAHRLRILAALLVFV